MSLRQEFPLHMCVDTVQVEHTPPVPRSPIRTPDARSPLLPVLLPADVSSGNAKSATAFLFVILAFPLPLGSANSTGRIVWHRIIPVVVLASPTRTAAACGVELMSQSSYTELTVPVLLCGLVGSAAALAARSRVFLAISRDSSCLLLYLASDFFFACSCVTNSWPSTTPILFLSLSETTCAAGSASGGRPSSSRMVRSATPNAPRGRVRGSSQRFKRVPNAVSRSSSWPRQRWCR